jgi:hypothetical protein
MPAVSARISLTRGSAVKGGMMTTSAPSKF